MVLNLLSADELNITKNTIGFLSKNLKFVINQNNSNSIMKSFTIVLLFVLLFHFLNAQIDIKYQEPDASILELADAPMPPSIRIDSKGENIILLHRNRYKSIAETIRRRITPWWFKNKTLSQNIFKQGEVSLQH